MHTNQLKLISIIVLSLLLIFNSFYYQSEHFTNTCSQNTNKQEEGKTYDDNGELILPNLDNIDVMSGKIDELADDEKETRMFCKILRNGSNNKEQMEKIMESRNRQFQDNLDKQNKMLCQIKSKIVNYKLNKDNKEFSEFNTKKNKEREAIKIRKKIMAQGQKLIRKGPVVNLKINDNYTHNFKK